jgi:hypothetical protein
MVAWRWHNVIQNALCMSHMHWSYASALFNWHAYLKQLTCTWKLVKCHICANILCFNIEDTGKNIFLEKQPKHFTVYLSWTLPGLMI